MVARRQPFRKLDPEDHSVLTQPLPVAMQEFAGFDRQDRAIGSDHSPCEVDLRLAVRVEGHVVCLAQKRQFSPSAGRGQGRDLSEIWLSHVLFGEMNAAAKAKPDWAVIANRDTPTAQTPVFMLRATVRIS